MLFRFHATTSDYLTLEVEAPSKEQAEQIARDSCGSQWSNVGTGDFNIEWDLTEEVDSDEKDDAPVLASAFLADDEEEREEEDEDDSFDL